MALVVHRAERTDALVDALGELVAQPLADPFTLEVVAVPTRGVERWISQRLSHRLGAVENDGVCAGVLFPSPARLVADVLAGCSGTASEQSPWSSERLPWLVLEVLDDALAAGDEALTVVRGYLDRAGSTASGDRRVWSHRRLAAAREVARLLESYAGQRPGMLLGWLDGREDDGTGERLPADLRWQAEVFRRVRAHTAVPSPAEVLPQVVEALADDPALAPLPSRVSVFGPTRLSTAELEVLGALALRRDVHLWLPHPSPALWAEVATRLESDRPTSRLRSDDTTRGVPRLPLLESLGRDARELQVRLGSVPSVAGAVSQHHPLPVSRTVTLLGRLQQALADDAEPSSLTPLPLAATDVSVQLHLCHGLPRQVEVLRELLVGLLADDPSLEPRDIVVMCPDVEAVAPLVTAAFGRRSAADEPLGHPGQRIRVKVADRSLLQVNPLLGLLDRLLALADARCTVDEVLGLLALPALRRRFGLSEDDLGLLGRWLPEVGVRWGLDPQHRALHGLPGVGEHTWQAGVDRLLLGVALSEDGLPLVGGVLPFDAVASQQAELTGRLAEAVERLRVVLGGLREPQPLEAWVLALRRGLDLLAAVGPDEEWQEAGAHRTLEGVRTEAGDAASTMLVLPDVRALLAERLAGRPTRASFRTGDLTVCSLAPMRSVPHRVVVLLGLDDDAFPRTGGVRGDDVLRRRPFVGDRDVRSEDRQILLDAIHAATERLVVLCTGMNPRTNAPEPPAVPVGELLDALHALVHERDHGRVQVRHPLQPFDERALVAQGDERPVASAAPRPFSFDPAMLATAQAARGEPREVLRLWEVRLPPLESPATVVEIADLVQMLENPAKGLLRQRLDLAMPDEFRAAPARLTEPLQPLQRWQVAERLLQQRMRGWGEASGEAEKARGSLPVPPLADAMLADLQPDLTGVAAAALEAGYDRARWQQVSAAVGDRRVIGSAQVVLDADGRAGSGVLVTTSKPKARNVMRVWVRQLALTVAERDRRWSSRVVDRSTGVTIPPVDPELAERVLGQLLAVRDLGLCCALPLPAEAASAFARSELVNPSGDAELEASRAFAADARDDALQRVWGEHVTFEQVLAAPPPDGVRLSSSSWFAVLARTVWRPVHEARMEAAVP